MTPEENQAAGNSAGLEILAYEDTPLGVLCLRRRALVSRPGTVITEITLNHELLMSSYHTESERVLSSAALAMHEGDELDVLVGGLGLGYTAAAVLRDDRVRAIEVVELLVPVMDWMRDACVPLASTLNADSRFKVTPGDIYERLLGNASRRHDLILIDVDHSPSDRLQESDAGLFYTRSGLKEASRHLCEGGILGVWSYSASSPFADALHEVFREVTVQCVSIENDLVDEVQTDWLFFARSPR